LVGIELDNRVPAAAGLAETTNKAANIRRCRAGMNSNIPATSVKNPGASSRISAKTGKDPGARFG